MKLFRKRLNKTIEKQLEELREETMNDLYFLGEELRKAENPQTPLETLEELAHHKHRSVRWTVAGNPSTPQELLKTLMKDPAIQVQGAALSRLEDTEFLVRTFRRQNLRFTLGRRRKRTQMYLTGTHLLGALAANPKLPLMYLEKLSTYTQEDTIRMGLASNRSLPFPLLKPLVTDPQEEVRHLVLSSREVLPLEFLEVLAVDPSEGIRSIVAHRAKELGDPYLLALATA